MLNLTLPDITGNKRLDLRGPHTSASLAERMVEEWVPYFECHKCGRFDYRKFAKPHAANHHCSIDIKCGVATTAIRILLYLVTLWLAAQATACGGSVVVSQIAGDASEAGAVDGDGSALDLGAGDDSAIVAPGFCDGTHPCPMGNICVYSASQVCPTTGVCQEIRLTPCITVTICGCDGTTASACSQDGVSFTEPVAHLGPCYAATTTCGELDSGIPDAGCPAGTMLAIQIGGPGPGGGGEWCAPIPPECAATPTCDCLGACVCGTFHGRNEGCSIAAGAIRCDNGLR